MDESTKMMLIGAVFLFSLLLIIISCFLKKEKRYSSSSSARWYSNCPNCINSENQGYRDIRSTYVDANNNGYQSLNRAGYIQWPPLKGDTKFGNPSGKIFPMEDTNLLGRNYDLIQDSEGYNSVNNPYFNVTTMNDTYMFTPRGEKYYLKHKLPQLTPSQAEKLSRDQQLSVNLS